MKGTWRNYRWTLDGCTASTQKAMDRINFEVRHYMFIVESKKVVTLAEPTTREAAMQGELAPGDRL